MKRKHKKRKGADLPVLAGCAEYSYMSPTAAINYLSINGFLLGPSIKEQTLAAEAQKLAGSMDCSFSPDMRRFFIACEADGKTGCCWAIIRHLYEKWHIAIPKPIQAFISIPEVWEAFLRMTAEQLNILLASDMEGEPFPYSTIMIGTSARSSTTISTSTPRRG